MKNIYQQKLIDLVTTKEFFLGIDSDGCAFDNMEIKHKECFCPNTILLWNLQNISKYVNETWEFVNLYSKSRGINRFKALIEVIELLKKREEVKSSNVMLPDMTAIIEWTEKETRLGNSTLEIYEREANNEIISTLLRWSIAINRDITKKVKNIPPFPFVRESLNIMGENADIMVVSQTPIETLKREWAENDLDEHIKLIAGQEYGTKQEHLRYAAKGKYNDDKILMIGDAPGDLQAAKENGVLFYPINPGDEEKSWKRFYYEGFDKFIEGNFKGSYENKVIKEFDQYLPSIPSWKVF